MFFASDAYPFCLAGASLAARPLKPIESVEETSASLVEEWSVAGRARNAGGLPSKPFEFAPGRPIRFGVRETGDSRFLRMRPRQVSWKMWSDLNKLPAAHFGVSFGMLDGLVTPRKQVAGRSEPMSAGGEMAAHSLRDVKTYGPTARLRQFQANMLSKKGLWLDTSTPFFVLCCAPL